MAVTLGLAPIATWNAGRGSIFASAEYRNRNGTNRASPDLRDQIRVHPLLKDSSKAKAERPFRLACIQLATYDGTIYNVRKVLEKIGHLCDYVLWDEAWIGYNAFHPLFEDHSPMRIEKLGAEMPEIGRAHV